MDFFAVQPVTLVYISSAILILMTMLSLLFRNKLTESEKKLFFGIIAVPILLSTFYMAAFTVHHDLTSATGGPIHWHLDYQVWVCGERLDLVDPRGLSNKIGSPLFHEHNDDRIHVEGTVSDLADVDLGSYFEVIGGRLTSTELVYPTEDRGIVDVDNGALCGGVPSQLRVYINGEAIENPETYLMYPHAFVPPADCGIIEFGPNLPDTTARLCESWAAKGWNYENFEQKRGELDGN